MNTRAWRSQRARSVLQFIRLELGFAGLLVLVKLAAACGSSDESIFPDRSRRDRAFPELVEALVSEPAEARLR
jgi:hypothetical protein